MIGRRVTATRLCLYTLQVYLEPPSSEARDLELWCDPSWHLRSPSGLLTGSGAIESPSSFEDEAEVARASATISEVSQATKVLKGQRLVSLHLDQVTHALTAEFSAGLVLATFPAEPDLEALWVLRDPNRDIAIRGTVHGVAEGTRARVV